MKQLNMRRTRIFSLTAILKLTSALGLLAVLLLAASNGIASGVISSSGVIVDDKEWKLPPEAKKMKNPTPANADSQAKGKALYDKNCQICHGATGDGNGPVGAKLNPKPPDLRDKKEMSEYTDGQVFAMIGVGKKPMPGFETKIPKEDRWHLVNYVRSLAK